MTRTLEKRSGQPGSAGNGRLPEPAGFLSAYPGYRGTALLDRLRATEYSCLDAGGHVYLDYTGSGLPAQTQLTAHAEYQDGKDQVRCDGGPGRLRVAAGLAISGRQLADDLLRLVLLPRSHVDVEPSCPQRGPQDSQTIWIKERRRQQRWCHRHSRMDIYRPAGPGRPYPHQRGRRRRAPGRGS